MLFLFTAMANKPLHIISFDNPYPPDYGGVIDVFYKLKSLHALGYAIHLHCFYDKRNAVSEELKAITETVHLYKKTEVRFSFFHPFRLPLNPGFIKV
ncbi:glycosyltransferase family protein [Flavobacterium phycosphaerae]|uniref:hypothetical protein n=1 Tax=Flavobacterium phycosphaerae TaxID=2697515 RepID=UPI0013894C22|nr:hypothetical protein [Flavobacterium phycosphaerae]